MFSKFLPGQRDSQLLLDSDNFTYSRKKDKDTPLNTAWRCSKNRSLKSSVTPWSISIPTTLSARVLNHKTRGVGQSHLDSSTQSPAMLSCLSFHPTASQQPTMTTLCSLTEKLPTSQLQGTCLSLLTTPTG